MSSLGGLTYASRDPWAGSAAHFETVPYIRQEGIRVTSLEESPLETYLIALQTDAHSRGTSPNVQVFLDLWCRVMPVGVAAGEKLHESNTLLTLARSGADVREAVGVTEQAVSEVAS